MKIYLDNNLGVTNVEQEELTQDTIGYNILKVYIPNAVLTPYDTFTCYYGALLQNGRKVGWFAMEARTSSDADYEANYTLYKATLEQCVVSVEGKVYIGCQVLLGNSGNATLIKKNTAVVQFNVRKSVAINNDILVLDPDQTTTDVLESYKNLLENALLTYATKAEVYTKAQMDALLLQKADKSDTYTKTEVDGLLVPKVAHDGNQLKDNNGNNIYPNLDDGQVIPEKTSFEVQTIHLGSLIYCDDGVAQLYSGDYEIKTISDTFYYKNINALDGPKILKFTYAHFSLEAGKTYTLAIFGSNLPSSDIGGIYLYDNTRNANITVSSGVRAIALHGASGHSITFTSTYDVTDGVLNFLVIANVTFNFNFNLMLVEGSVASSEYKQPIRYIDEGAYYYFTNLIQNINNNVTPLLNLMEIKNKYRYLIPTFFGNNNATNSLILLGSNDLHTFDLLKEKGTYIIDSNISNAEFMRDPAIIQIGDYFYITYSISMSSNTIGMCRTKDFTTFETLTDLTVTNSDNDTYYGAWAPAWVKENDKYYIVVSGKISSNQGYFDTLLLEYNPTNHTLGTGYKLLENQNGVIDGHIYKDNGYYYLITNSCNRYKSDTLLSTFTRVTGIVNLPYTEGEFAIRLDNGKWRIFAQSLTSGGKQNQEMYYIDVDTLEDNLGLDNLTLCNYTDKAQTYVEANLSASIIAHFWHWTIFDFNNRNDNNNNFIK